MTSLDPLVESLYFGNVPVWLTPVDGEIQVCHPLQGWSESDSRAPVQCVDDVRLPEVPGGDILIPHDAKASSMSPVPLVLQQSCYMKTATQHEGSLAGVVSGVRSALVRLAPGEWYRLKGCGNNSDGFLFESRRGPHNESWRELRGCLFEQTARREIFVTSKISNCVNLEPYIMYRYSNSLHLQIKCVCAVERTLGDRRLGTHVLSGLDLLMDKLLNLNFDPQELYPPNRPPETTTADLMSDFMLGCLAWSLPRDEHCLADARGKILVSKENLISRKTGDEFDSVWNATIESLKDGADLGWLFARLGQEAGESLRKIHDCGFVWGTYQDSQCRKELDEWHCNAHSNNLVARSEGNSLLALLDLDMAFPHFGNSALMQREHVNLMEVLAGADSSTGAPLAERKKLNSQAKWIQNARWVLRDTLVLAYKAAYEEGVSWAPTSPEGSQNDNFENSQLLIRLALIETIDFIA